MIILSSLEARSGLPN